MIYAVARPEPVCNPDRVRSMPPRVRAIVDEVAEKHGVMPAEIIGIRRFRALSHARFEAMFRVRSEIVVAGSEPSLPLIGSWFGGRDHTTVLNALQRHAELTAEAA